MFSVEALKNLNHVDDRHRSQKGFSFVNDLPGGATIFCHFWKSVVFKQSLGLSA